MTASDAHAPATLSVRVTRFIQAPPQDVFEAWIKPEIRKKWWLTARGDGLTTCEIDARPGGRYCLKQIGGGSETPDEDDDYEWVMDGEFLEVVAPKRLVFTWNVNHPEEPVVDQRVTVELREVDRGTEVTITHEGILSNRLREGTEQGWTKLLQNMAEFVQRQ